MYFKTEDGSSGSGGGVNDGPGSSDNLFETNALFMNHTKASSSTGHSSSSSSSSLHLSSNLSSLHGGMVGVGGSNSPRGANNNNNNNNGPSSSSSLLSSSALNGDPNSNAALLRSLSSGNLPSLEGHSGLHLGYAHSGQYFHFTVFVTVIGSLSVSVFYSIVRSLLCQLYYY